MKNNFGEINDQLSEIKKDIIGAKKYPISTRDQTSMEHTESRIECEVEAIKNLIEAKESASHERML